jgi:hypothetical protein
MRTLLEAMGIDPNDPTHQNLDTAFACIKESVLGLVN